MRKIGVALGVLTAAALAGLAGWIAWRAVSLLADEGLSTSDEAAALQAVAAAAALLATLVLVGVTGWYTWLTARSIRQSGPIVTAKLSIGWLPTIGPQAGVITVPFVMLESGPPDDRYTKPIFAIELTNAGNAAVAIDKVSVASGSGVSFMHPHAPVGPTCPFELKAHSSATAFVEIREVAAAMDAWRAVKGEGSRQVRAEVRLGSGSTVCSGWETLP